MADFSVPYCVKDVEQAIKDFISKYVFFNLDLNSRFIIVCY